MKEVYLLLGSNKGNRLENIISAILYLKKIDPEKLKVLELSSIYETQPEGINYIQPAYLNIVIKCMTTYQPLELLDVVESIEKTLGRKNKGKKMPRTIDIDILLFGDMILNTPRLKIPHPQILERSFVPHILCELSETLLHPECGKKMIDIVTERKEKPPSIYLKKEKLETLVL